MRMREFGIALAAVLATAATVHDACALPKWCTVHFTRAFTCDTCTASLCPETPLSAHVECDDPWFHPVGAAVLAPAAGSTEEPVLRVVLAPITELIDFPPSSELVGIEVPPLPPGDHVLTVELADSLPGGAAQWNEIDPAHAVFVDTTTSWRFPVHVAPRCPPAPPPFVRAVMVGPPDAPGMRIPVELTGVVTEPCVQFERIETRPVNGAPDSLRLTFARADCGHRPCRVGEDSTFACQVSLPVLPPGEHVLSVEVVVRSACDTTRVLEEDVHAVTFAVDAPPAPRLGVPGHLELGRAQPNPFTDRTTFLVGSPRDEAVNVIVVDLAGRRVAVLADRVLPAGWHVLAWDGRDSGGRFARDGIYFVRARSAGGEVARKLLLRRWW